MGYTHYWKINQIHGQAKKNELKYKLAILECSKIVKAYYKEHGEISGYTAHCKLGEYGGLNVNGKGEDAHEDFEMREHFSENKDFNFCKTARKPYDIVVTACLALLKHRLGDAFTVSSDGRANDWAYGVALARIVTKLAIKNPINDDE